MGSTPVANPSPPRRWRFSRRVVPLAFLALAVVALIAIGVAVIWLSDGADSDWVAVARTDELSVKVPRAVQGNVYLVRRESGEILALSQTDPHGGCNVVFSPILRFMGNTGWFQNSCFGETYDLIGVCYAGPCVRGLDRYGVRVLDGDVEVNLTPLTEGPDRATSSGRRPVN